MAARSVQIAACLDHEVAQSVAAQDGDRAVDGIALPDTTEVDAHSTLPQKRGARPLVHDKLTIVDERQQPPHVVRVGNGVVLVVIELPQSGQRA